MFQQKKTKLNAIAHFALSINQPLDAQSSFSTIPLFCAGAYYLFYRFLFFHVCDFISSAVQHFVLVCTCLSVFQTFIQFYLILCLVLFKPLFYLSCLFYACKALLINDQQHKNNLAMLTNTNFVPMGIFWNRKFV
jgi:hypothetical protein